MPRFSVIRPAVVALAIAIVAPASRLAAQSVSTADSTPHIHMLAPVNVEASNARTLSSLLDVMSSIRAARYENHRLSRQLALYDRKVTQLETRLVYLKTVVTDSLRRDIAATDSATAATHAERLRLEERLRLSGALPLAVADSVGGVR